MTLEFYFDLASPYAYVALTRLTTLALPPACSIAYHPVNVEEVKRAAGNIGPPLHTLPSKKRYALQDAGRWAKRYGTAFTEPAGWNATRLNRGTFLASERGMAARYLTCASQCVWGEGGDPASEDLIGRVARAMGWTPQELLDYTLCAHAIERQKETLTAAHAAGVFGVPTCVLNGQLWWGNDRLTGVEEALAHADSKTQEPI